MSLGKQLKSILDLDPSTKISYLSHVRTPFPDLAFPKASLAGLYVLLSKKAR